MPKSPQSSTLTAILLTLPVPHVTRDPDTGRSWQEPTMPEPNFVTLASCSEKPRETIDGCITTINQVCRHGHPS
ncbi:hypothetical protein FV226_26165 [Methylobacterium sp. WL12]|nr:hypothetical protein FV226_26165 [Methylobacterium sp. WL12]